MKSLPKFLLAAVLASTAFAAQAHTGHGTHSLMEGLVHPFGLDHLLAMVAVGVWSVSALPAGKAWQGPATFLLALVISAALGAAGATVPYLEHAHFAERGAVRPDADRRHAAHATGHRPGSDRGGFVAARPGPWLGNARFRLRRLRGRLPPDHRGAAPERCRRRAWSCSACWPNAAASHWARSAHPWAVRACSCSRNSEAAHDPR